MANQWQDISERDYFVFTSDFGNVRVRKRHGYPQTFAFVEGSTLYFGYGEAAFARRVLGQQLVAISETQFYDEEFLLVAAACDNRSVTLQRDAFSTLPLFAASTADRLVLSSDFGSACRRLQGNLHVDGLSLLEYLMGWQQCQRTLFREIMVLYDRARLLWHGGNMTLSSRPTPKRLSMPGRTVMLMPGFLSVFWKIPWNDIGIVMGSLRRWHAI